MNFTDEQIRLYCPCGADWPERDCPLHGGFSIEWRVAFRNENGEVRFIGVEQCSDEKQEPRLENALNDAEYELKDIAREGGGPLFLVNRVLGDWRTPR